MTTRAALRNLSLAALASATLGGCYYGDVYSASYTGADCSSRYGPSYWSNDPYAYDDGYYGYDCYDAADYGSGFVQIGFGGGWYQQLYYPGYGLFLFDRYGRRHSMSHEYLTYWGGRRAWWKHHGHRYGSDGHRRDGRHDGRRPGRGYGQGGDAYPGSSDSRWNNSPGAAPVPQNRPRGEGWRGRPRGHMNGMPSEAIAPTPVPGVEAAPPSPRRGAGGNGWGGRGAGQGEGNWTPPAGNTPRMPEYREPVRGNDGASEYVAPPRPTPQVSYTPPPAYNPPPPQQPTQNDRARLDMEGAVRED